MTGPEPLDPWGQLARAAPGYVTIGGAKVAAGSRVRLWPAAGGDLLDIELAGRTAVVEGVDQDLDDTCYLAVILDEDPGRDLGHYRQPGHRFFFRAEEVEPLPGNDPQAEEAQVLVAGVGDEFKGDSGFGLEVVRRLAAGPRPPGITATEFGIRIRDLGRSIEQGWDAVIVVAALAGGGQPGELSIAELGGDIRTVEVAGVGAVDLPAGPGGPRSGTWLVGCQPKAGSGAGLSEPVTRSVDRAAAEIGRLASQAVPAAGSSGQGRSRL